MQVSKGLGTYAGLITAFAQYLAAIALFLEADDQALALGPLATATLTLITVIAGRMKQANTLAAKPAPIFIPQPPSSGTAASSRSVWFAEAKPGQGEFAREPKAPHPDELRDLHDGEQT